ncbi:O-antigen/teichoic acid export membrane protein [Halospina denitrificans]|uniref:O-antigen/teichoic acid export membrane protein n=1 Tax=Halospina denitrificans TaxID=332522 RepID=A0A4R7JQF2_9GAMM|nr:oligosaccharide flippase family protein [Halospina denitrificans]TDT39487.1 O-antigen/teichoic acid export membrane protein [Halospina denitrificans]
MSLGRSLIKGSVFRVSNTLLAMAASFIMMPVLIGELGDRWYGIWSIVAGFMGVYHTFDLGVTSAVSRYISRYLGKEDYERVNEVVNTGLVIFLGLGLLVCLFTITLANFSAYFVSSDDVEIISLLILITGFSVALEFPFNAFAGIAEAKARFDLIAMSRILVLISSTATTYWFVTHGYGVIAIAIISFIASRVSSFLYFMIARRLFPKLIVSRRLFKKDTVKELFSFSIWSFAVELTSNLPGRANPMVIGYFLSASAVTEYVVGQRLVDYSKRLLYQATNMMTPVFTQYHARDDYANIREKLVLVTRINACLGILAISGLIIFADLFIRRWIGTGYDESYLVVVARVFGAMGIFIFSPVNNILYAINRHSLIAKITFFEGITIVLLAIYLVNEIGIIGVALASAVPGILGRGFLLPLMCCRVISLNYFTLVREVLPIFIVGSTLGASGYYYLGTINIEAHYIEILSAALCFSVAYGLIMVLFMLKSNERALLLRAMPFLKKTGR